MPGLSLRSVRLFSALVFSSLLLGAAEAIAATNRDSRSAAPPERNNLQKIARPSRQANPAAQTHIEADYAVADAQTLADFWGIPNVEAQLPSPKERGRGYGLVQRSRLPEAPNATPETEIILSSILGATDGVITAQAVTDDEAIQAYANSADYGFRDAEVLANFWGISIWDAKITIGRKLLLPGTEGKEILDRALAEARMGPAPDEEARGAYFDSGYGFEDAQLLANFWGISTWDAKAAIGHKLLSGPEGQDLLDRTLIQARNAAERAVSDEAARGAYFDSSYSFRDAEALANFWGISTWDAKAAIGHKILSGPEGRAILDDTLSEARAADPQANAELERFFAANYSFNDAETLAAFWGLASPLEAKMLVGRKLLAGRQDLVEDALRSARARF